MGDWHAAARLVAVIVVTAGAFRLGGLLTADTDAPGEDSADVGFARDMSTHHAQAVELAELARDRTDDFGVRILATDIALTQQAQIGRMHGWLDAWNLPPTSTGPAMAWMGHPMTGPMPGMATDAEIDQLREANGTQADELFLRLMIRHHRGGALMADTAARLADQPEVQTLARTIRDSQTAEIDNIQDMLRDRGLDPEDTTTITMPTTTSTSDRSLVDSVVDAVARWWLVALAAGALTGLAWNLVRPARDRAVP